MTAYDNAYDALYEVHGMTTRLVKGGVSHFPYTFGDDVDLLRRLSAATAPLSDISKEISTACKRNITSNADETAERVVDHLIKIPAEVDAVQAGCAQAARTLNVVIGKFVDGDANTRHSHPAALKALAAIEHTLTDSALPAVKATSRDSFPANPEKLRETLAVLGGIASQFGDLAILFRNKVREDFGVPVAISLTTYASRVEVAISSTLEPYARIDNHFLAVMDELGR